MRLLLVGVCSVMSVGSAAAQPGVCNVSIVRAPDAVREVVEGWVRAEPRCSGELEVRIVPTDGGYYLFARDGAGRIRERVVPDPQSAGVLIASWAAADSIVSEAPPLVDPMVAAPTRQMPPSAIERRRETADPTHTYSWGGWLTLGGLMSEHTR